jgi:hypothetical protein
MASISPLGPRGYQNTGLGSNLPTSTRPTGTNELKRSDSGNPVSLSSTGLDLQQRVGALGHATVDLAQNLLNGFAKDMFGDAMEGATVDFDSVSLESASSFAAGVMSSEGADGVFNAAAFSLKDSSHFIGKGTITLADGQKYDFEIEVQYEASLQAGASSSVPSRRKELADQNPAMPLPAVEFPDIDFPGSLADLFKLFDKPIGGDVKKDDDTLGSLSLRLLKLVNQQPSDTYAPADKAKNVADAYGAAPAVSAPAPEPVVDTVEPQPVSAPAPERVETYTPQGKGDAA